MRYPIYIPSKGRVDHCYTANFLDASGLDFWIVVEPQEADLYAGRYGKERILVLPFRDGGSVIPARNWIKEHAIENGHIRHWQFDDNMRSIKRWWKQKRIKCSPNAALTATEDFVDRYENVAIAGLNYSMFCMSNANARPPFHLNCRVYSCSLILNSIPHRWRGRYNEDADICLQVLADGWCTVLMNAFMVEKMTTMVIKGGNTTEIYQGDGRTHMARSLERVWPHVVTMKRRFRRSQHVVRDAWRKFDTPLKRRSDIDFAALKSNEYGMELTQIVPEIKSSELRELVAQQFDPARSDSASGCSQDRNVASKNMGYKHVQGGNVPGGHNVLWDGKRKPFITPMKECNSIPLYHWDTVVDIGAYVGTYAIRCARHPVKRIIAYEPTPHTFQLLSMTSMPNMKIVNAAVVGDDRPDVDLFVSKGIGVTNSIVLSNRKSHTVKIPAIRYEDAIADATVVKIDVEGAEYSYQIIQPQLRAVILDFHKVPGNWIVKAEQIVTDLLDAGFKAVVTPDWSNGWTCAGSWSREIEPYTEVHEPLMRGELCCGCGTPIQATARALCPSCWPQWTARHRSEFVRGELRPPSIVDQDRNSSPNL